MPVIKKNHYISQYFMEPLSSLLIPLDSHGSTKACRVLKLKLLLLFFVIFLAAGLCKCKVNLKERQFIKSVVL